MPLLLVFTIFLLDKIFYIPFVYNRLVKWDNFDEYFYQTRKTVFLKLKNEIRPVALVLGTSRSLYFSPDLLTTKNIAVYNFSAPGSSPEYYFYWYQKIKKEISPIKYVIIEIDSPLFSKKSNFLPLAHSYDFPFLLNNLENNPPQEASANNFYNLKGGSSYSDLTTFILKRIFLSYKISWEFGNFFKESNISDKVILRQQITQNLDFANIHYYGAFPQFLEVQINLKSVKEQKERIVSKYLNGFIFDPSQKFFMYKLLKELAEDNIPVILYWPLTLPEIRAYMDTHGFINEYQSELKNYIIFLQNTFKNSKIQFIDPFIDPDFHCRELIDANHMTGKCLNELGSYLMQKKGND